MSSKSINGKSLYLRQIKCGVRTIIEDLDSLRIKYGNECVQVLTPKVEVRLRSGFLPAIPLRVQVTLQIEIFCQTIIVIYELGYPETVPLKLEYSYEVNTEMVNKIDEYRNTRSSETGYHHTTLDILSFLSHILVSNHAKSIGNDICDNLLGPNILCKQSDSLLLNVLGQDEATIVPAEAEYKCVVCRTFLFRQTELNLDHFSHDSTKCTSYFLNSLPEWHQTLAAELNGKITCPNTKCSAKLGHWNWAGVQCGCEAWITPGFQITKSRVDPSTKFLTRILAPCSDDVA